MSDLLFGIELVLVFGLVLAFAAWDYHRTDRALKQRREEEERERAREG